MEPVKVTFFLGYENPRIYVSRNLPKGSCDFELVKRHEQTHQQINTATLEYFIPMFNDASKIIAKSLKPIKIKNVATQAQAATQYLSNEFNMLMTPQIEILKRELQIENGKLDNSLNYSVEAMVCHEKGQRTKQVQQYLDYLVKTFK